MTVDRKFQAAVAHHRAGRIVEAIELYRQLLIVRPDRTDARVLLAEGLLSLGQYEPAIEAYRAALAQQPNLPDEWMNLGVAFQRTGKLQEAADAYRGAIRHRPANADACSNLSDVLRLLGRFDDAITAGREATRLRPDHAGAWNNLGNALLAADRAVESVAALETGLRLRPNDAMIHNNLGAALRFAGRIQESIAAFIRATQLRANYAGALLNLSISFSQLNQTVDALACGRAAVNADPRNAEAWLQLGIALKDAHQADDALAAYERALQLKPELVEAHRNIGHVLWAQGRADEALAAFRKALAINPDYEPAARDILFHLYFHPAYDGPGILREHQEWAERFAKPLAPREPRFDNGRSPQRRLRIGYLSSELYQHAVGFFLLPLLQNHDRRQFEIVCYNNAGRSDAISKALASHSSQWRNVLHLSDAALAEQIRSDGIDILVDLSLHSGRSRMLVLARRPAPVQTAYLGYTGTTGLPTVDWRMTDEYLDPPDAPHPAFTERAARLQSTYWCYAAHEQAPDIAALPPDEPIVFGCLNVFAKASPPALAAWAAVLAAVPRSRLIVSADPGRYLERVKVFFRARGIAEDRLEFAARMPLPRYLATYGRIHVALDPFPYTGATTTCDALWMGVPVVSLVGEIATQRAGLSIFSRVGLGDLAVDTVDKYVATAVDLAQDRGRLSKLRSELRERMQASPLMDARAFARDIERLYREMWSNWCRMGA